MDGCLTDWLTGWLADERQSISRLSSETLSVSSDCTAYQQTDQYSQGAGWLAVQRKTSRPTEIKKEREVLHLRANSVAPVFLVICQWAMRWKGSWLPIRSFAVAVASTRRHLLMTVFSVKKGDRKERKKIGETGRNSKWLQSMASW